MYLGELDEEGKEDMKQYIANMKNEERHLKRPRLGGGGDTSPAAGGNGAGKSAKGNASIFDSKEYCYHFAMSTCRNGDDCPLPHKDKKDCPCPWKKAGHCKLGTACNWLH
jgi:hypothetical protein